MKWHYKTMLSNTKSIDCYISTSHSTCAFVVKSFLPGKGCELLLKPLKGDFQSPAAIWTYGTYNREGIGKTFILHLWDTHNNLNHESLAWQALNEYLKHSIRKSQFHISAANSYLSHILGRGKFVGQNVGLERFIRDRWSDITIGCLSKNLYVIYFNIF